MSLNLTPERQTALEEAQTLANTSLIEPKDAGDIVLLDSADQATSREIERIMGEVDLQNSNSHFILRLGRPRSKTWMRTTSPPKKPRSPPHLKTVK